MNNDNEYILGEEVTQLAKAKSQKGTVVLSVRLSAEELRRLDNVSRRAGKTVSQVVREAITSYEPQTSAGRTMVTWSFFDGPTVSNGESAQYVTNPTPRRLDVVVVQ